MSLEVQLQIGRQTGQAQSKTVSVERLVNGYLEQAPEGKEPAPVYGIPGLDVFADLGSQPIRGMFKMGTTLYAVSGTKVYSVNSEGTETFLGTVGGSDLVDMASDGTNLVIVSAQLGKIYIYDGTTVEEVTDPDAPLTDAVDWADGYYIFNEKGSDRFFISELADPTQYDPLDYASAEYRPDLLVRPLVSKREVLMMGTETIEAWRNTGDPLFPFTRLEGFFIDVGLIGRYAATVSNDAVWWLASDLTVRRLDGVTATRISSYAVEKIIAGWSDPSLTKATAHVWRGHLFILFVNPEGCVVFDQATERWHERISWGLDTYRARTHVSAYSKLLFGDGSNGKIYEMTDSLTEGGEIIAFDMTWPYVWAQGKKFTTNEVEVIFDTGSGSYTDEPKAVLFSSDDGRTWSTGRERGMGLRGDFARRVVWTRLGQARQRTYRLRITDPVKKCVLAAYGKGEIDAS